MPVAFFIFKCNTDCFFVFGLIFKSAWLIQVAVYMRRKTVSKIPWSTGKGCVVLVRANLLSVPFRGSKHGLLRYEIRHCLNCLPIGCKNMNKKSHFRLSELPLCAHHVKHLRCSFSRSRNEPSVRK